MLTCEYHCDIGPTADSIAGLWLYGCSTWSSSAWLAGRRCWHVRQASPTSSPASASGKGLGSVSLPARGPLAPVGS